MEGKTRFYPRKPGFLANTLDLPIFCGCEEIQMNLILRLYSFDLANMGAV